MSGKKYRAIRDILFEELFSPIDENDTDREGTVFIPAGTKGTSSDNWKNAVYIDMRLPRKIKNPFAPNIPVFELFVPADAFEEVV